MKFIFVIICCMSVFVAATGILAIDEEGLNRRQRRNHRNRHKRQSGITGELDTSGRNDTQSIKNTTNDNDVSGWIQNMHSRNHTHHNRNTTDDTEPTTKLTRAGKKKAKRPKTAKALKGKAKNDMNATAATSLSANGTDIHEGKHKHPKHAAENDVDSQSKNATETAIGEANNTTSKTIAASDVSSFATKISPFDGEGVDPQTPWADDKQLEAVLASVDAEYQAKKQDEEMIDQKMVNSANSCQNNGIGISWIVGLLLLRPIFVERF